MFGTRSRRRRSRRDETMDVSEYAVEGDRTKKKRRSKKRKSKLGTRAAARKRRRSVAGTRKRTSTTRTRTTKRRKKAAAPRSKKRRASTTRKAAPRRRRVTSRSGATTRKRSRARKSRDVAYSDRDRGWKGDRERHRQAAARGWHLVNPNHTPKKRKAVKVKGTKRHTKPGTYHGSIKSTAKPPKKRSASRGRKASLKGHAKSGKAYLDMVIARSGPPPFMGPIQRKSAAKTRKAKKAKSRDMAYDFAARDYRRTRRRRLFRDL